MKAPCAACMEGTEEEAAGCMLGARTEVERDSRGVLLVRTGGGRRGCPGECEGGARVD
jgi:hypothetical protein